MEQKLLVVVSIVSARNFPRRPDSNLLVEASLNGETLSTDPLPHISGVFQINTELAWEMTKKAHQHHKLHRTPIKLQCFAVDKTTKARENVGYVMLDLRAAHANSQQGANWYGVLNSSYSRLKPQLQVALSLETQVKSHESPPTLNSDQEGDVPSLTLNLDPTGGHYVLGPSSQHQVMYTLSVTLHNVKQLPKLPAGHSHWYFYYCLLGNDITSEPFTSSEFAPERASIRIKSTRELLAILLASQADVEVHLCCGSESVTKSYLSLTPLKSTDSVNCTLTFDKGSTSIEATVQLEATPQPSFSPAAGSRETQHTSSMNYSETVTPVFCGQLTSKITPVPSAKRNLTQSFEEASLSTPSQSNATPSSATPSSATPTTSPKIGTNVASSQSSRTPSAPPTAGSSQPPPSFHPLPPLPSSSPSNSSALVTTTQSVIVSGPVLLPATSPLTTTAVHNVPLATTATNNVPLSTTTLHSVPLPNYISLPTTAVHTVQQPTTVVQTIPQSTTTVYRVPQTIAIQQTAPSLPVFQLPGSSVTSSSTTRAQPMAPGVGERLTHRYKFSVDLRSIHNTALDSKIKCYLRYNYPFFGCPYPVLVQPPVVLSLNVDAHFTQSYCSFEFATIPHQLHREITLHPLVVEVWQSCDQSHDHIVGIAKITLGEVLSGTKAVLDGGITRQVCSLRALITPPPPTPHTLIIGHLNTVLVLEDHGIISLPTQQPEMVSSQPKTKPSSTATQYGDTLFGPVHPHVTRDRGHLNGVQYPQQQPLVVHSGVGALGVPHTESVVKPAVNLGGQQQQLVASDGGPLVGSMEYTTAMELEVWKLGEEEAFQERLKQRESAHMAKLGEEMQRRETQRQELFKQKLEQYSSLERQLQQALEQLQIQQKQLADRELKIAQEKERLTQDKKRTQNDLERSVLQVKTHYEQQVEIERLKSIELQSIVDSLKKQVRDLEAKVRTREAEFESYRQQTLSRPESKLQAELSITQLEKAELERKLSAMTKSKQHYKEQWSKALSELAMCRQKEQAAARERLLAQQQELEVMRAQYLHHEQQNSLKQQINQVRDEVERLQEHTLAQQAPLPKEPRHPWPPPPTTTTLDEHHHSSPGAAHDSHMTHPGVDSNVARWIEERDILLQTGVYSSNDPTIQKLDLKIRQALAQQPSTSESKQ